MSEISKINDLNGNNLKSKKILINYSFKLQTTLKITKIIDYISFVKIISAYAVIILHTNPFYGDNFKNKTKWIFINFIEQFFIFGVPMFVLCVGATLLDFNEKYGLVEYYKRRFFKVVLPLICWNIILYYYRVYFLKNLKNEKFDIVKLLNLYFQNKIYVLFYSFHIFIIHYMIIPLLAYVDKSKKIKIYFYCFFTLLVTQSLIPYIIEILHINLTWPYNINVGYIIYIFSGYIIENYKFSNLIKKLIYIIGLLSFLIQIIGTHILTYKYRKASLWHTGYLKLPTVLYCNSLFLFIKDYSSLLFIFINKDKVNFLGTLTIGPFFLHLPLMDFFRKYPKFIFNINIISFLGGNIICIICFLLTFIIKKIPIINYLVP